MLDTAIIQTIARRLHQTEINRRQIRQVSLDRPDITIEGTHVIQREWITMKLAAGRCSKGYKIGLTSRTIQQSSQVDEPNYGVLLNDMFFTEGNEIPTDHFVAPHVGVGLAFMFDRRPEGPEVTLFDIYDAVDHVIPALEIIDTRSQSIDPDNGCPRKVSDTIADNTANAGAAMGGRPIRMHNMDLRWVSAIFLRNTVIKETGMAASVLNHPASDVVWLANELAPHGVALEPDQVILDGSFTRPVPARAGDTFHYDYGPLDSIACHFV